MLWFFSLAFPFPWNMRGNIDVLQGSQGFIGQTFGRLFDHGIVITISRLVHWWVYSWMGCWEVDCGGWPVGACPGRVDLPLPPPLGALFFPSAMLWATLPCHAPPLCSAALELAYYGLISLQTVSEVSLFSFKLCVGFSVLAITKIGRCFLHWVSPKRFNIIHWCNLELFSTGTGKFLCKGSDEKSFRICA